jgi:hypothetical protein
MSMYGCERVVDRDQLGMEMIRYPSLIVLTDTLKLLLP